MAEDIHITIARLIRDHFPWGEPKYPAPVPEPDQQRRRVEQWLERRTTPYEISVTALLALVEPILREVEEEIRLAGENRLVHRIDLGNVTKSPASILEKMAREWQKTPGKPPPVSFNNFERELADLGRFRIVTNFLSDVERVEAGLAKPYGTRRGLSEAQRALAEDFRLRHNRFDNRVLLHPGERKKGERCCKGVFEPRRREESHLRVEVQIETLLQEAWDKKDHYLLYEPRRRGETVALEHECEMFAMSELLYVADLTFDRLREAMLTGKKGSGKGDRDARS